MSTQERLELADVLDENVADYITATITLLIVASFELKGSVHLGCDAGRTPTAEKLRVSAPSIVLPLLARTEARQVDRR
jgi:hypothetical protein